MSSLTATFAAQLFSAAANFPAGSRVSLGAFFVQPPMRRLRSRRLVCSAEPYLITKLESAEKTWKELSVRLADPDVASNPSEYQKLAQSLAELDEVVSTFRSFKDCEKQLEKTKALAKEAGNDEDVAEMINSKVASLTNQIKELQARLKLLLLSSDPLDAVNIMLEVRAGSGTAPEFDKDLKKVVQKTAATFAPRASTASKNPAVPGSVLYTVFEVQAYACLLLGGALSFNLIFPSNEPDLWRLMGMWSIWMFTIPSLRARDCSKNEKEALNYLFLLVPLLNVMIPFFLKSFAVVWSADVAAFFGMYAWKLGWFSQKE